MELGTVIKSLMIFGVIYILIGSYIERFLIYATLQENNVPVNYVSWSYRELFEKLDSYKKLIAEGKGSSFFYWYVFIAYKFGPIYVLAVMVLIALKAISIIWLKS